MLLTLDEILAATGGTILHTTAREFGGVTIDGRAAKAGDLYVAIQGERFDGHDFCAQAVAAGAAGCLVSRPVKSGATEIQVRDTRIGIGEIGRLIRRRWAHRVVGVTGSAGKTTTKELIAAMLAPLGPVLATEGSLNNETGVPLTLARLRDEHRFAVIEMGMRGLGQIDYLAAWAEPDVGVVVNAGVAHVGVVGSVEKIAEGKSEMWNRSKIAVYPHGDARLTAHARAKLPDAKHVTFGTEAGAAVRVLAIEPHGADGSSVVAEVRGKRISFKVPLVGKHNAMNGACAIAVAVALDVDLDKAIAGLANAKPAKQRSELAEIAGRKILVDCYNANPASMRAALETVAELAQGKRAAAVLGDMLELGDHEDDEHATIGRAVAENKIDHLVAVGPRSRALAGAARAAGVAHVVETEDPVEAARAILGWTQPGDWILVKASRGMRLERVVEALR